MQTQDIPTLPIAAYMQPQVKSLRQNAPEYLRAIVEDTYAVREVKSLAELGRTDVQPLAGGMLSAVYVLQSPERSVVIKLRYRGIKAEAESLKAWEKQGANVTKVIALGVIPQTKRKKEKVKYLILETISDRKGDLAPTAEAYSIQHPRSTKQIGMLLGVELAKIHRAKTSRTFGEFADMWGKNNAPIKSWNQYLLGYLDYHHEHLQKEGFTQTRLKKLRDRITKMHFSHKGTFLHGDYSMRNAMIVRRNPLQLKIFDPNPLIGDPSWDLAILYNNEEYARRKYEYLPKKRAYKEAYEREKACLEGLIAGYEAEMSKPIDREKVRVSQLIQTIFLLDIEENKARSKGKDPEEEIEVMVRKDALSALIVILNLETRDKRKPLALL